MSLVGVGKNTVAHLTAESNVTRRKTRNLIHMALYSTGPILRLEVRVAFLPRAIVERAVCRGLKPLGRIQLHLPGPLHKGTIVELRTTQMKYTR